MPIRVAINGFGRIGRSVFRIVSAARDIDVVAVNDLADAESLVYLLKYDTVMGRFPGQMRVEGDTLYAGIQDFKIIQVPDLDRLPWKELGVDVVVESTGRFRRRADLEKHLAAGAGRVILTVPAKDDIDATVVLGVNDASLRPAHRIISNASCTTNCLAPLAKILHDAFKIEKGIMTTVHAYTNDQRLADVPHSDLRRSRAAAENIIPTTTGAARAVGKVLPELAGKLDGTAMRVPVPDGSIVDLVAILGRKTSVSEINETVQRAAQGPLKGIVEYCEEPIVSSDVIGNPHSSIFDSLTTQVLGGNFVRLIAWYDNEWGYACRVADLVRRLAELGPPERGPAT